MRDFIAKSLRISYSSCSLILAPSSLISISIPIHFHYSGNATATCFGRALLLLHFRNEQEKPGETGSRIISRSGSVKSSRSAPSIWIKAAHYQALGFDTYELILRGVTRGRRWPRFDHYRSIRVQYIPARRAGRTGEKVSGPLWI